MVWIRLIFLLLFSFNLQSNELTEQELKYFNFLDLNNDKFISIGGRVLNITSTGKSFKNIRKNIFKTIRKINWKKGFIRKDIGWRVIS